MTSPMAPTLCTSCVFYKEPGVCPAFPRGIPTSIGAFGADHRKPVKGQTGTTVYQLKPGKEHLLEAWTREQAVQQR